MTEVELDDLEGRKLENRVATNSTHKSESPEKLIQDDQVHQVVKPCEIDDEDPIIKEESHRCFWSSCSIRVIEFLFEKKKSKKFRQDSLDVFRGLVVYFMTANKAPSGQSYYFLEHAEWDGITLADFGFPAFLFIMGYASSIVFSRNQPKWSEISTKKCLCGNNCSLTYHKRFWHEIRKWFRIIERSLLMITIGLIINFVPFLLDGPPFRIPGVFQRLGICYLSVSVIQNVFPTLTVQIIVVLILHMIYVLLMFGIPYPNGCGAGNLTRNCCGEAYFDRIFVGKFDPEGTVSTLNAICTTFLGVVYYRIFKFTRDRKLSMYQCLGYWMIFSSILLFIGLLISEFWAPYNKHVWSASYVCATAGVSGLVFSVFFFVVDILEYKKIFLLFTWFGVNPLLAYCLGLIVYYLFFSLIPIGQVSLGEWIVDIFLISWIRNVEFSNLLFGLGFASLFVPLYYLMWRCSFFCRI